ncbi:formamidopyrimidine-DNA glycosylase N-terminal domain-containing protein [Phanerochaete sordida]|uniref:Formamidopyrimidine-DNA glycosylase N-terminal domain-containing protein n=1 Tax=Phanerochaete sordida TaxID=48140 RepID=A0A9P3G5G4_9APHY|nr:formamidopyrimidine-DNA glycosylase N-terminal domain-containing protein [Phanerochaete sordida]
MPELPEVQRAVNLLRRIAKGRRIAKVAAVEDTIVFSGTTHTEFEKELEGRTVKDVARYGKVFYMELDGKGRMPVLHFGMTGMLQVKGQLATYYKETPKKASTDWPPRFMKFNMHLHDPATSTTTEVAFLDARRLGRVRLVAAPRAEPPISALGFDPLLSMPPLAAFAARVRARSCPAKALLLDQGFSAGVGNWVADEVLYHARVHPERRCNTLSDDEIGALHEQVQQVCRTAVEVDADDTKFPEDWLFKHRWGKGKKKQHSLLLPSGEPATIKWVTVGGRTSAYVVELQKLSGSEENAGSTSRSRRRVKTSEADEKNDAEDEDESDLTPLEEETPKRETRKRKVAEVKPDKATTQKAKRTRSKKA